MRFQIPQRRGRRRIPLEELIVPLCRLKRCRHRNAERSRLVGRNHGRRTYGQIQILSPETVPSLAGNDHRICPWRGGSRGKRDAAAVPAPGDCTVSLAPAGNPDTLSVTLPVDPLRVRLAFTVTED